MKKLILGAMLLSFSAFAGGSPQTHHCEVGGATVTKTKKDCKAAGGKWAKNTTAGTPPAAPAPATK
jgi:hypothetical protein